MRHLILTALAWVLQTSLALAACGTTDLMATLSPQDRATLDARVAAHPYPQGNLWQATRAGTVLTLVGSMHLHDPRHAALVSQVEPALETADAFYLEVTKEQNKSVETRVIETPEIGFFVDGPTLIDRLPPETWEALKSAMQARGVPGFFAAKLKPWYAGMMLQVPPCAMGDLISQKPGLDLLLEAKAIEAGLPRHGLDDPEALLTLLTGRAMEDQIKDLIATIAYEETLEALHTTMVEAYFRGEHRAILEFSSMLLEADPTVVSPEMLDYVDTVMTRLLDVRNRAWVEVLADIPDGTNAVVVVGAGHLSGEAGVLALLEREGFVIAPL